MKTNSREKQPTPNGQPNRLNRTQQPPQPKNQHLDNTYHGQKKPTMYEKTNSDKNGIPPRAGSTQKINYKIEDNMTQKSIQEAKHGLQLLKKKMVRTGMSREKNQRPASIEKRADDAYNPRKVNPKQEEYHGYEKDAKKPTPPPPEKKSYGEDRPRKTPQGPSKSIQDRPMKRQPPQEEYSNPNEEVPINSNQNFMAILERQMAKENKNQPQSQPTRGSKQQPVLYDQENEQIILGQCSKGCGRKFNVNTLAKHEKVCEKVFQSKRKAFDSASRRQAEVDDFQAPLPPANIKEQKSKKSKQPAKGKIPKWKEQSAAFRAGLKAGRGEQLTKEQKQVTQHASGMVQCPVCGRKFNEDAGKRHITFCESKAKQLPKMNVSKRK